LLSRDEHSHFEEEWIMQKRMILGGLAMLLMAAAPAMAQNSVRSAGSKISGSAYREWSSNSYRTAAYGHATALDEYSRTYTYIPEETAKEHAAEIRRNVTAVKTELAKLAPTAKTDKSLAKHIDTLNAKYDKVLADCTAVETECAKGEKADLKKVTEGSNRMSSDLKTAEADHKSLHDHLKKTEKK
jgi:lipoate-protein ligase A